jgi:DNA-binding NarL/FixJ family response regulator
MATGSSIRVLLVDMPRMMREIVATVVGAEPDLELVGEIEGPETLTAGARRTRPDLVIAGADPALGHLSRQLLGGHPRLRILEVDVEGRRGYLYELSPRRRSLGELSPKSLLAVARQRS